MAQRFVATVARGLEAVAAKEIQTLGGVNVKTIFSGVAFEGNKDLLYKVNLWSRTVFRVLLYVDEFRCVSKEDLYDGISRLDLAAVISPDKTLAIDCTGSGTRQLNNSQATALKVKDAIVDQQRRYFQGRRSEIDADNANVRVNVFIRDNKCIVSLDSSGEPLYRRGYRLAIGEAPLKETLAASLLLMSGWTPEIPFVDPMCGSGTLAIEAALMSLNIAPGLIRRKNANSSFAFEHWSNYDQNLFQKLLLEAKESQRRVLQAPIQASDLSTIALSHARANAERCGLGKLIKFQHVNVANCQSPAPSGFVFCNPPYGERLGNVQELPALYKTFGDVLKERFGGWTAWILSGDADLSRELGLKATKRIQVLNGKIDCRFLQYDLHPQKQIV